MENTGTVSVNVFFCILSWNISTVGKCQVCGVQESVKHVIMFCLRYAEERRLLFIGLNVLGVDIISDG